MLFRVLKNIANAAFPVKRDNEWYDKKVRKKLILKSLAYRSGFREKVLNTPSFDSISISSSISDIMKKFVQYDKTSVRLEQIGAFYLPYGIEYRTPLNDIRLIQYCMSIPPEQLYIERKRSLMRRATKGVIPESIRLGHNKHQGSLPNLFDQMWEDRERLIDHLNNCSDDSDISSLIDLSKLEHYMQQQNVPEFVRPKLFRNIQMALYLAWLKNNLLT